MRLLQQVDNGITLEELLRIAEENGLPLNTRISIMGAETRFIIEDKGRILLDERNCIEELNVDESHVCSKDDAFVCQNKEELEIRYQNAIKKIGHEKMLELPTQVKEILHNTKDLQTKVKLLEEIAKTV